MTRIKFTLLAAVLALLVGCSTTKLEPGGSYAPFDQSGQVQPDLAFYIADAAYDIAYSTVDAAFKFEYDNRALLWKLSPQIKHTLDGIRPQAIAANLQYAIARRTYLANPVPANLTGINAALAKIQQLAVTAISILPKEPSSGLTVPSSGVTVPSSFTNAIINTSK